MRRINRNQIPGQIPQNCIGLFLTRIACDAENSAQNTNDIPVQNWRGLVESDAADRPGRVAANSRQRENVVEVPGKPPVMPLHDDLSGGLRVPDTTVVAQALPQLEDFLRPCPREIGQGWQLRHPALKVRNDRLDLGLLEHDFRHEHGIRFFRATPRQIPCIRRKPFQ